MTTTHLADHLRSLDADQLLLLTRTAVEPEVLRAICLELLTRSDHVPPAAPTIDLARLELRLPVATAIDFTAAVFPPSAARFSPVPALIITLHHRDPTLRRSRFVLQVLPDLTRLDATNRFADAVRSARLKAPA